MSRKSNSKLRTPVVHDDFSRLVKDVTRYRPSDLKSLTAAGSTRRVDIVPLPEPAAIEENR
jgi:hypothetical protein